MRLYIAEKPSMGAELAKCLKGPNTRKDGYIITGEGIVTWVYGHILRQAEPFEYDHKYRRWLMEDLPIVPTEWLLLVADSCSKQFAVIKSLVEQCTEIVHAGDPDREGQLLIDEVLDYLRSEKPVQRVLLNALDEKSIKKAINSLRSNAEFINLKKSALARARADWLIGMNASRAYTIVANSAGHKVTLPIGRVKTPTLALVVRRERELENFKPIDFYILKAQFRHNEEIFSATWKPKDIQAGLDSEGRLIDSAIAQKMADLFKQETETGVVSLYQTTEKKEPQRLPFSLSALQVLAGKKYNYDPQLVLDTAQKLYEKKLTSYPRSDCDYLPENQFEEATEILNNLRGLAEEKISYFAQQADAKIKSRAWNDKKITAHHAIVPTQEQCNFAKLSTVEQDIYFLIAQAYIAQFYPLHIYDQTKIEVTYQDELFATSGRVIKQNGWKAVYGSELEDDKKEDESAVLPAMLKGDQVHCENIDLEKKATRPPTRFTAATLLAAMKEIHKYVKNPELKKSLKDVAGIGTEATRATIIKELTTRGFLQEEKKKKYLIPTTAAFLLVDILPEDITYPDYTATWENALQVMAEGGGDLQGFLREQIDFINKLCQEAKSANIPLNGEHICPSCKKAVLRLRQGKNGAFWGCSGYPSCRATFDDDNGKPKSVELCPKCNTGIIRLKKGINGAFWGCSNFPQCRSTYNDVNGKPDIKR